MSEIKNDPRTHGFGGDGEMHDSMYPTRGLGVVVALLTAAGLAAAGQDLSTIILASGGLGVLAGSVQTSTT